MLDVHTAPDASARPPVPHVLPTSPGPRLLQAPNLPPVTRIHTPPPQPSCLILEAGRPLDAKTLRDAMTRAFGADDARGAWVWKDAYEAAEAAVVLFIRRHGRAMRRHAGAGPEGPSAMLRMLEAVAALEPSHTRRSEEQVRLQQFSTPLPLAYAALQAASDPAGRRRAGALCRHGHAGGHGGMRPREPGAREPAPERDRGRPPRAPVPALPGAPWSPA